MCILWIWTHLLWHFHCSKNWSIFTALKILCVLLIYHYPFSSTNSWQIDIFPVSIVLPFLECHIVGIILHTAYSDWLLWLSDMHLRFFCVLSWFDNSVLFLLNNILLSRFIRVYLSIHPVKNIWGASKFVQLWIKLLYKHLYIGIFADIFSAPLGKYQRVWALDCINRVCLVRIRFYWYKWFC